MKNSRDGYVSVKNLALELGLDRSQMRKFIVDHLDIQPDKQRVADSRGSLALVVTDKEADIIRRARRESYCDNGVVSEGPVVGVTNDIGFFYVIALIPELDPCRLKFGFAESVAKRLANHKTAAPTAMVLKSWPSRRGWEKTAIDCMSVVCRLILGEVYECDDVAEVLFRGDRFFALLPSPNDKPTLAACSPKQIADE